MRACFFIAMQTVMARGMHCMGKETWRDAIKDRDLTSQTQVITGGDTGIGYQQALALATANAQVVLACRDSAKPTGKCQTAVANIKAITGNQRVSAIPCDLSSFASVRSFASVLKERVSKVDVLTNNAGIAFNDPRLPVGPITDDGFDRLFQVNLLGHHLLVEELLPLLRRAKGRVIHVASSSSLMPCLWGKYLPSLIKGECTALDRLPDAATRVFNFSAAFFPNGTCKVCFPDGTVDPSYALIKPYSDWVSIGGVISNYGLSKYLLVFHAAELAKREAANGVTAFSLHPGVVDTDMVGPVPGFLPQLWCDAEMASLQRRQTPCPRTAEMGAATQTYLAVAPLDEVSKHNGVYFDSCKPATVSAKTEYELKHLPLAVRKYQAGIYDMCVEMTGSSVASV